MDDLCQVLYNAKIVYSNAMTPDLMHALAISGGILIGVVILIIIVSMVTVRRGEAGMQADAKQRGHMDSH